MENLSQLGALVEASSNADIARGAASALRRKLTMLESREDSEPDDEQYLDALEVLLSRQAQALNPSSAGGGNFSMRHLHDVGQQYLPIEKREPAVIRKVLDDVKAIRGSEVAEQAKVISVLRMLDDLMKAWLEASWQARQGRIMR